MIDGAPGYCNVLAKLSGPNDAYTLVEGLELYLELLDGLAAEGPPELRDQISGFADDTRALEAISFEYLNFDQNLMTADGLDTVNRYLAASDQFDALGEQLVPAFREDCGDEFIASFRPSSQFVPAAVTREN